MDKPLFSKFVDNHSLSETNKSNAFVQSTLNIITQNSSSKIFLTKISLKPSRDGRGSGFSKFKPNRKRNFLKFHPE
jgi:hypothetical protein